jgi:hypothetical protein
MGGVKEKARAGLAAASGLANHRSVNFGLLRSEISETREFLLFFRPNSP